MSDFTRKEIKRLANENEVELPKEFVDSLFNLFAEARDAYADYKANEAVEKLKADQKPVDIKETDEYKSLKQKFDDEHAAHEKLKSDVASKETVAKKEKAFKSLLKDKQYSEEAAKLIIGKGGYTDKIELDSKGNIKNADSILGDVQNDFAMFTPKENNQSANPANPPANVGGKISMTADEIMKIKDTEARQLAMAQNAELFGIT